MEPTRHSINVKNTGSQGTHEIVFYDWGNANSQRIVVWVEGERRATSC